jgi:hypothetical protein
VTNQFDPGEAESFINNFEPVIYLRCMCECDDEVSLACFTFLDTMVFNSDGDFCVLLSSPMDAVDLQWVMAHLNTSHRRLGRSALCSPVSDTSPFTDIPGNCRVRR